MCLNNILRCRDSNLPYNPLDTEGFVDFEDSCDYIEIEEANNTNTEIYDLIIMQINTRGLIGKQKELSHLLFDILGESVLDAVILCETWLTQESEKRVSFPGYTYYGIPRKHKKGGGVGFLLRDNLKFKPKLLCEDSETDCESCFVEISLNNNKILLGSLYRPPNTDPKSFLEYYNKLSNHLRSEYKNYVIGLDHNLNLLNHENHKDTQTFLELIIDYEQYPCITRPTRLTHHSATLLDNIIVPQHYHVRSHSVILITDLSDHLPCLTTISKVKAPNKEKALIKKRNMSEKKIHEIASHLEYVDFEELLMDGDANTSMNSLHTTIMNSINTVSPEREIMVSLNKTHCEPWLTKGLRRCSNKQLKLYKKYLSERNTDYHEKYKQYRNLLTKIKQQAKREYYFNKCVEFKSNTKKLWSMINTVTGKSTNKRLVIESLKIDNIEETNTNIIANNMCKYFAEIGMKFAKNIEKSNTPINQYLNKIKQNDMSVYLSPTNKQEVLSVIKGLKNKKSSGWDGISNKLLKDLAYVLAYPLSIVFNKSIDTGIFPEIFKIADVIPLHKSGAKNHTTNFRPISLLVTISKVLEKLIHKHVYTFLDKCEQIYQESIRIPFKTFV